jgi:hypothetical protein
LFVLIGGRGGHYYLQPAANSKELLTYDEYSEWSEVEILMGVVALALPAHNSAPEVFTRDI